VLITGVEPCIPDVQNWLACSEFVPETCPSGYTGASSTVRTAEQFTEEMCCPVYVVHPLRNNRTDFLTCFRYAPSYSSVTLIRSPSESVAFCYTFRPPGNHHHRRRRHPHNHPRHGDQRTDLPGARRARPPFGFASGRARLKLVVCSDSAAGSERDERTGVVKWAVERAFWLVFGPFERR
jgi:hypothetical protein